MQKTWKLKEIVVASMISAVLGAVLMLWSNLYMPLSPVLGPIGIEILYGMYFVPGILVAYIIRKPGAAILGGLVSALIEILLGSPFGFANIMIAGFVQGLGAEIIFMIKKYKSFNMPVMLLSGVLTAILIFVRDFLVFGYGAQAMGTVIGMLVVRIISGALLGGLFSKLLGDILAKTGVLSNFNISRKETM